MIAHTTCGPSEKNGASVGFRLPSATLVRKSFLRSQGEKTKLNVDCTNVTSRMLWRAVTTQRSPSTRSNYRFFFLCPEM